MKKVFALAFLFVLACGDSTKPADNPTPPTSSGAAAPADSAAPAPSK